MSAVPDTTERYLAPTRLLQALAALAMPGGATVLAGGTDLMPQRRSGRLSAGRTLLNVRRVPGLDGVTLEFADRESVRGWLTDEPFTRAGLYASQQVHRFCNLWPQKAGFPER